MSQTETMILNMGPQHPSTHGVLRLVLELDGERVLNIRPDIGYLHSGIEKTGEHRTYRQVLPYTDRMDYASAMTHNLGYVLAVEKLLGIEVPPRAQYIRVMMAELNRIASHLLAVGSAALDLSGLMSVILMYTFWEREKVLDLFEAVSGQRMTPSYFRIGGLVDDLPEGWLDQARALCAPVPQADRRRREDPDAQPDHARPHCGRWRAHARDGLGLWHYGPVAARLGCAL
jgi:NADH-quinone oxidoreductase subunit D